MRILRRLGVGIVVVIAAAIVAGFAYRAHMQHRLARETRIATPNGIDEAKYIEVNGAQEWVTIRGQDRSNPVILFLHGGPAEANSPFVTFYLPFEKDYVFVQWDQPGAGMTYIKAGDDQTKLTLDEIANDGIAAAEHVRDELHQPKITLIGQDWGGVVGIHMIEKRLDLFTAFVGTGQIVGMMATQRVLYQYALNHAAANRDQKMLSDLKQVGPPPYRTLEAYGDFENCCRNAFWPADDVAGIRQMQAMLVFSPQLTLAQAYGWYKGLRTNEVKLDTWLMTMPDLRDTDTAFSAPVFFIQGENDNVTPTNLVADYYARIQAPIKGMDVIPDAGHFVMWTHAAEFLRHLNADAGAASEVARSKR
ncbi:MAG: alpha/beta hydrolase [Acidobacteriota bacterium]|nr:alpha/beta hydrolase [Acidobacteriota bacterium]